MKITTKTIRIERTGNVDNSLVGQDISETELDSYNFDYIIINNKDLESLNNRVEKMLSEIDIPDVFLISGKKRSGKDTVSKIISESIGYEVVHFADELKNDIIEFNNYTQIIPNSFIKNGVVLDEYKEMPIAQGCENEQKNEKFINIVNSFLNAQKKYGIVTYRNLLIQYGCDMRDIDKDFWIKRLLEKHEPNGIIISDFRFINEHQYFLR